MLKKLTQYSMLIFSLFLLSTNISFAAESVNMTTNKTVDAVQVSPKININEANSEDLALIKGIGPTKAQAIVDYRESNGKFNTTDELINVKGIGKGTLDKIAPFISI